LEILLSEPRPWFPDFRIAYYPAGFDALHGLPLSPLIASGVSGFVNLPIVAYLFAPLALLPWQVAAAGAFPFLGLVAITCALLLLVRLTRLGAGASMLMVLLFAFNGPLIYSLKLGNTSHFVLLALVGALCLIRAERFVAAGVLLGLAALIKLPLLLFGVYLVARRAWTGVAGFVAVLLIAAALSLLAFGVALHWQWLDVAIVQFNSRVLGAFNVQSIPAMLVRLRDPAPPLFDWAPLDPTWAERIITKLVQVVFAVIAGWGLWRSAEPRRGQHRDERKIAPAELQFLVVLVLALVLSPMSWSHYYCWLLIPAAYFLGNLLPLGSSRTAVWVTWLAILLASPLVVLAGFSSAFLEAVYTRLIVSNYLISGIIWLVILSLAARGSLYPYGGRASPVT